MKARGPWLLVPLLLAACASGPSKTEAKAEELLAEGRRQLAAGELEAAAASFEAAAALDGSSVESRVWVVRSWIAEGRVDEALAAADELKEEGAERADLDYLYGLAFHASAVREAAAGGSAYTQGAFEDAARFLATATAADPERYGDAYFALAESAWYASDLPLASEAAARAVELRPEDMAALLLSGRVAFSRYSAARTEGADAAALDGLWEEARAAFEAAVDAGTARAGEERTQYELALAHEQLANLHLWREDQEAAARAFGEALAWDPRALDFNRVREALGGERFAALVLEARAEFAARHPMEKGGAQGAGGANGAAPHPGAALLTWWAAFGVFEQGKLAEAEALFLETVGENPDYVNCWYYVFRAAYGLRQYEQSLIALRAHAAQNRTELVGLLGSDREINLRILEFLVSWLIDPEVQKSERFREAALLAELTTVMAPEEPRYWNNLGLFLRDHGDQLKAEKPAPDPAELAPLWESAYAAYQRTLELAPDHPAYLNDPAVMLHYSLERELERAEAMYVRAIERAEEELAGTALSTSDRDWLETVSRDAAENLEKLREERDSTELGSR
jgi:tetratricopeptide (TPR) repeat protein